ncbi:zinc finger MYND domain-containing protein, partial [bacterium]|nr:zinc finger MYND domain-containing protein [bacterium]
MASTDTSATNCAACGKEGGNLNTCNKCNMVKYCNAACKKKHRSRHKKACERRVAELHDEELFKEHPPRDDCPICFLTLPVDTRESTFHSCCGKIIC